MNYVLCCHPRLFDLFHLSWPKDQPLTALVYRQPSELTRHIEASGVEVQDIEPHVEVLRRMLPSDYTRWCDMPGHCLGIKLALPVCLPIPFTLYDDDQIVNRVPALPVTSFSKGVVIGRHFPPRFWLEVERELGFSEFDQFEYDSAHSDNGLTHYDADFDRADFLETIERLYRCPYFTSMSFSAWRARTQIVITLYGHRHRVPRMGVPTYKIVTHERDLPKNVSRYDVLHYVMGKNKVIFAEKMLCSRQ